MAFRYLHIRSQGLRSSLYKRNHSRIRELSVGIRTGKLQMCRSVFFRRFGRFARGRHIFYSDFNGRCLRRYLRPFNVPRSQYNFGNVFSHQIQISLPFIVWAITFNFQNHETIKHFWYRIIAVITISLSDVVQILYHVWCCNNENPKIGWPAHLSGAVSGSKMHSTFFFFNF